MTAPVSYRHRTELLDKIAFARMSIAADDPNLVHIDHLTAAAAGLDSVIGTGIFVVALIDKAVRDTAGFGTAYEFEFQMRAPIRPDRWLEITVQNATEEGSRLGIIDSEGTVVAKGKLSTNPPAQPQDTGLGSAKE
jgi:hypothetical protein